MLGLLDPDTNINMKTKESHMKKLFVLAFALAFTTAAFAEPTTATTPAPDAAAASAEKAPAAPAHAKKVKKATHK